MTERNVVLDKIPATSEDGLAGDVGSTSSVDDKAEADPADAAEVAPSSRHPRPRRALTAFAVLAVVALGATSGVLLKQHLRLEATRDLELRYLQAARQSVLDLTTISAATVDDDVARVLERSTGTFRDQFGERSDDFVSVVEQADVQANGSITEAGIENADDNAASVLVAATSSVTNSSGAQEESRVWRLRITLDNDDGTILVSDVEFVP